MGNMTKFTSGPVFTTFEFFGIRTINDIEDQSDQSVPDTLDAGDGDSSENVLGSFFFHLP